MKSKFVKLYMTIAETVAMMSHAKRLNVGAIIVKDDRVISMGYNGMPGGWDNNCEDKEFWKPEFEDLHYDELEAMYPFVETSDVDGEYIGRYRLRTKPEVLHAETNAIAKLARSSESGLNSDLFVTHAPCLDCAKIIYQAGIGRVWFGTAYRDTSGVEFLKASGVQVTKVENDQ